MILVCCCDDCKSYVLLYCAPADTSRALVVVADKTAVLDTDMSRVARGSRAIKGSLDLFLCAIAVFPSIFTRPGSDASANYHVVTLGDLAVRQVCLIIATLKLLYG